jgi:hypothetical protein
MCGGGGYPRGGFGGLDFIAKSVGAAEPQSRRAASSVPAVAVALVVLKEVRRVSE